VVLSLSHTRIRGGEVFAKERGAGFFLPTLFLFRCLRSAATENTHTARQADTHMVFSCVVLKGKYEIILRPHNRRKVVGKK
jgi:hypothetical protein